MVLGMLLERDCSAGTISISQEEFVDSLLARFNLTNASNVATPFTPGTHLFAANCATSKDELEEMACRPYTELLRG